VERNKNSQLRVRALQEIAASRDDEAFRTAVDVVGTWSRDERREGAKVLLQALAERRIGRRDEASQWIWDIADMTRDVHEEYAVQRWPETKRLLGLLVNSSGGAHARNARRLVHAARKQDRRLSAAILAAAVAHTPEAMEVVRGARTRMARKPSALSRELLRNFPKGRKGRNRRRRKKGDPQAPAVSEEEVVAIETGEERPGIDKPGVPVDDDLAEDDYGTDEDRTDADLEDGDEGEPKPKPRSRSRRSRSRRKPAAPKPEGETAAADPDPSPAPVSAAAQSAVLAAAEAVAAAADAPAKPKPKRRPPKKKTEAA
jgi:ribonuclease E